MTSTTDGPKQIQRYKIGCRTDEWGMRFSTPSAIPDPTGPLVKFDDAVQLVSGNQDTLAELEQEARLMRARMERLQAERDGIVATILTRLEAACGAASMPPTIIRSEFLQRDSVENQQA